MKYILIILLLFSCSEKKQEMKLGPIAETVKDYDIAVEYVGDTMKEFLIKIDWENKIMRVLQAEVISGTKTWKQDTFYVHRDRRPLNIMLRRGRDTIYIHDTVYSKKVIIRDVENVQIGGTGTKATLREIGMWGTDKLDPAPETSRTMFWEFKRRQQKR